LGRVVAGGGWCRGGSHGRGRQSAPTRTVYVEVRWLDSRIEACSGSEGGERDISQGLMERRLAVAALRGHGSGDEGAEAR
jgi:hypothetical protein